MNFSVIYMSLLFFRKEVGTKRTIEGFVEQGSMCMVQRRADKWFGELILEADIDMNCPVNFYITRIQFPKVTCLESVVVLPSMAHLE